MREDLPPCVLRVAFRYDHNLKFADAFANEVKQVTLYAYNAQTGQLAYTRTETAANILAKGYLDVTDMKPGTYHLIAWAEGENRCNNSYLYGQAAPTDPTQLTCEINNLGNRRLTHDLTPLFHGKMDSVKLEYGLSTDDTKLVTLPLTKNTNVVRIVLQNTSGAQLKADEFNLTIDDDNRLLGYDNLALEADSIEYTPWSKYAGSTDINQQAMPHRQRSESLSAVVAEFTLNRLFTNKRPILTVRRTSDGQAVFRLPLIDYLLLVKGNYHRSMSDQEYLDREDEYNMTFFLDNNRNWLSACIYINSWRVVLQQADF